MKMTATIDATGTTSLDLDGDLSQESHPSVAQARRAVMATATTLAEQTCEDTRLHLEDPSGARTLLVAADGTTAQQDAVAPVVEPVPLEATAQPAAQTPVEAAAGRSLRASEPVVVEGPRNPFVAAPEVIVEEDSMDVDPILGARESIRGPQNLQQTLAQEPATDEGTAVPVVSTQATLWLVGASGGVGTSTLAGLCSETVADAGVQEPGWACRALLVCSTSAASLDAAARHARASATGRLAYELAGLVIVHDRPKNRITRPTLSFARSVARMFPVAMTVPYEPAWREVGTTPTPSSTRLRTVLRRIEKIARTGH
ncbi:hypothetical protein GCM10011374_37110 [Kocuria dechangensis]|uniref:Uncharacterized protein n=1 Tax=Kocuria dechangensis TaxID=1176249 RepID=A0A917H758_9MICC|nr:DUF6668 family protein [Kocuria dechangensis]GGG69261.1 hypothetical protein GCM10011374_37110 [Kocuria dechangensis]